MSILRRWALVSSAPRQEAACAKRTFCLGVRGSSAGWVSPSLPVRLGAAFSARPVGPVLSWQRPFVIGGWLFGMYGQASSA